MQTENHSRSRFFLHAVLLGLLALLATAPSLRPGQFAPAADASSARQYPNAAQVAASGSVTLVAPVEAIAGNELGVALEDPDEIVRGAFHRHGTFVPGYAARKLGLFSQTDLARQAILSPPLLV